ncbi:MAG: leucyl/phenylalanyl-tRNA--protein transferase [Thiohalocapsa sp. PB-PSB1]|nr:MAG: leucyl/phenylalanyl-tRNA--protein transferase [Thiohalocapsa sp. PB-PSB1]HCS89477.1 leucyl/phenylalanyl-tRNA--protein transferase [Chromatiaceae bacterium]
MRRANNIPYLLAANDPSGSFPPVSEALTEPDGLLAIGGDLSVKRLIHAYRHGIFPWYGENDPILWWSPDPRTILVPDEIRISRSLRKFLRKSPFEVTMDRDFRSVIHACAMPREPGGGTWLMPEMISAYRKLHALGIAHSVEVWKDGMLAGGLYGIAVGAAFFGESMFTRIDNASKIALVYLCRRLSTWNFRLIDCQVQTDHLLRMGARHIPRTKFIHMLEQLRDRPSPTGCWDQPWDASPADASPTTCEHADNMASRETEGRHAS